MKISTGKGDIGSTSLLFGERIHKTSEYVCACGAVDELNALLGMVRAREEASPEMRELIFQVQKRLSCLMTELMVLPSEWNSPKKRTLSQISQEDISFLDSSIESYESSLPIFKEWLIPGDNELEAVLNFARTVCRRAERELWFLAKEFENTPAQSQFNRLPVYLNRLSDLLWLMTLSARIVFTKQE